LSDRYEMYGLEDAVNECHSIAWDTCHKIYILMDKERTQDMESYEYEAVIYAEESNPYDLLEEVREWYESSCSLKFVEIVFTNDEGEVSFYPLVAQGEDILEVL